MLQVRRSSNKIGRMGQRLLSLFLAALLATAPLLAAPTPTSADTGGAASGASYLTDADNWNGDSSGNSSADGDLDIGIKNQNKAAADNYSKYPVEFKIEGVDRLPTKSAHLLVRALDVDEYYAPVTDPGNGEWDRVYFSSNPSDIALGASYTPWNLSNSTWSNSISQSGIAPSGTGYLKEIPQSAYLGTLSGKDSQWNTSVIAFDPSDWNRIALGDNYVGVTIHHYYQDTRNFSALANTNWQMTLDWGQLIIDGGDRSTGEITDVGLTVENGKATIDTSFIPKLENQNFTIEVNLIEKTVINGDVVERNVGLDKHLFTNPSTAGDTPWDNIVISDNTIDPSKEYVVNIILFEDRGGGVQAEKYTNPGKAVHLVTFSTKSPFVQEIKKSGYRADPTYLSESDFQEKFDSEGTLTRVEVASLPDAQKGQLYLDEVPVTAGQIIDAADLDLLNFRPVEEGFDGIAEFLWNGFDGTYYAPLPAKVIINSSPEVQDMSYLLKSTDTGLTFTGPDGFEAHYIDPGQEPLERLKIVSLPDAALGKLVYSDAASQEDVQAGDIIDAADIGNLSFIVAEGAAGTATFDWNGWDGLQFAKDDATVTITINHPPVVDDVKKSGKLGEPVAFAPNDFALTPAYTDEDGQPLHSVRIPLPSNFASQGTLSYTSAGSPVKIAPGTTAVIAAADLGSLVFQPSATLEEGSAVTFPWYGSDGLHESELPADVIIDFQERPIGEPIVYYEDEGVPSVTIVLNGSSPADPEGAITVEIDDQPLKGTVEKDPSDPTGMTWIYTPDEEFALGTDTFTYTVTDSLELESDPITVTIHLDKKLNGWVGNKEEGDDSVVLSLPGEKLKLTAVSSRWAESVTADVYGTAVELTLKNGSTWTTDGYKLWENTEFVLPLGTPPGLYAPVFTSLDQNEDVLDIEASAKLDDNKFRVLKTNLELTANPEEILGDGVSTTELTAKLTDEEGNPIPNVEVTFSAPPTGGTFDGPTVVTTDENGEAKITYISSKIIGIDKVEIPVQAKVYDVEKGLSAEDQITITFMPASINGVITKGDSTTPVAGATVRVTLDLDGDGIITPGVDFDQTIVTDAEGKYSTIVPKGDAVYDLEVVQTVVIGGVETPVTYHQQATVGTLTGTDEKFDSEKTATGIVLFKQPNGETALLDSDVLGKSSVYLKDENGQYVEQSPGVPKSFALSGQGVFNADGLAIGTYELELRYEFEPGKQIVFLRTLVNISESGQLNIVEALVDPYGTVTNAVTHAVIEGAKVVLKYADTPRNVGKGITPNEPVTLPEIVGFDPNDNASPEQLSDINGFYAYMVYPETDYYLEVTKSGYYDYRSPVISVEHDIVKHDVALNPFVATSGGAPSLSLSETVEQNVVKEGSSSQVTITYKIGGSPTGTAELKLTLPAGVEVVDAAGGTVTGNTIVWKLAGLSAGQEGSFKPTLKWPLIDAAEQVFELPSALTASGASVGATVKVNVYSDRYEDLEHYRYILGYPDKEFKPTRSMTRAELAAIVARLTENKTVDYPLPYTDIREGHWATNYIKIATKYGYFTGGTDGKFRPDEPITRGELAMVMARYLKLEASAPASRHFSDTAGHWAGNVIEALYNGKFLKGYTDGTFKPSNTIVRSEAVTMVNRMLYRGPLLGLEPLFPDVPKTNWAFGDVQEATISHTSVRNEDGSETWKANLNDDMQ